MSANARPLSPHIQIYRWQIQMMTSILHRATGIALAAGTLVLLCSLLALAAGPERWADVAAFGRSGLGTFLLLGWTWSLAYHWLNGLRHLLQDLGWGYRIEQFVRNGWLVVAGSLILTILVWVCVFAQRGGA
ncbi:succinate dehydrogenase, cytochrome b556 subunit [Dokdonella sp.]|uniref:succinate dehydrogenase, cytochrome b556 subunit n=1 Tax=Dokdonella sp. TaxID=2291710 RepID=UPI0025BDAFEF|nr:succinate dehydrogenase, cytochrome b556 subunit [Dokdonella sp.]MBX3688116.1 succinate dehydrogenase, cytochrome b556 subunit [Dokdonella sp.]